MRGIACIRVSSLIAKRTAGLSDAELLRLEQHLAGCERCGADARQLAQLAELARSRAMPELAPRARERALDGALRTLGTTAPERPAWPAWWLPTGVTAVVAAAAVLAYVAIDGRGQPMPGVAAVGVELGPVVATLAPDQRVRIDEPTQLAVGAAGVRLDAGSSVRWTPASRTLQLHSGRVRARLGRDATEPFRIETRRFVAEVTGAELEVTAASVKVVVGTARVFAPDGEVYVDELVAGEVWRAPPSESARESVPAIDVDAQLAVARRLIALGDVRAARRGLTAALAASPSRRQRAEAQTLLAECALVAGEPGPAASRYLRVANRYRDMPAGENALFAAARIRANAGHSARARRSFGLYLKRYPNGRFRAEARARLDALDGAD